MADTVGDGWFADEGGYSFGSDGFTIEAGGGIITDIFGFQLRSESNEFIFLHELGHTLGLRPSLFRGIDSREVSYSDYPSAMNYNQPWWGTDP